MTLDQLIHIYRKSQIPNEYGSLVTAKVSLGEEYARVRPMSGMERNGGDQIEARANYRFHINYRSDLIEDDFIEWNGHQYNIRFIADAGDGDIYLSIEAQRGVAI